MRICRIRQIPRREPKFHHDEMFDGAGRSMNALFTIFISGWDFRMLVISVLVVEFWWILFGVDGLFNFFGRYDGSFWLYNGYGYRTVS